MTGQPRHLTFAWWNLHNFAHYDASHDDRLRWPKSIPDYEAKRDRVLAAFGVMFGQDYPDLLAVCEITREAAQDLTQRLPSGFGLTISPTYRYDDKFQVAIIYRLGVGLSVEPPLLPAEEDLNHGTRPMIPVNLTIPGHVIRFVACHWTAFEKSRVARQRLADVVKRDAYNFLYPAEVRKTGLRRHAVILGDLNEEPMSEIFEERLIGCRDRESSRGQGKRDDEVRRVQLYNAAWRYLGEQTAHSAPKVQTPSVAGTYYQDRQWRTFDHVLVSSSLLSEKPPYFDEAQTGIVATPIMVDEEGLPRPFEPGKPRGVSDHLPVVGRIVLSEATRL